MSSVLQVPWGLLQRQPHLCDDNVESDYVESERVESDDDEY